MGEKKVRGWRADGKKITKTERTETWVDGGGDNFSSGQKIKQLLDLYETETSFFMDTQSSCPCMAAGSRSQIRELFHLTYQFVMFVYKFQSVFLLWFLLLTYGSGF